MDERIYDIKRDEYVPLTKQMYLELENAAWFRVSQLVECERLLLENGIPLPSGRVSPHEMPGDASRIEDIKAKFLATGGII